MEAARPKPALRDLKAAIAPPKSLAPWLIGGATGLLVLGALLLLAAWLRGRSTPSEPEVPPHEIALRDFDRLARGGLLRPSEQGPFAYELSAILRRYLEARFAFGAWSMTTPEVMRAMPVELATSRPLEGSIRQVLEASDFVKFAGEPVPVPTLEAWLRDARGVVTATRPRPEPEP